jgi:hypothetical protein
VGSALRYGGIHPFAQASRGSPPPFLTYTSTSTSLPFGATSLVVLRHLLR